MTKHLIKALQTELDNTRSALDSQAQIISRIKSWLVDEVNTYQEIQTRISDGEEIENIADAPEVFFGRSECAEGLLSRIEEWEDGNE